MTLGLFLQKLMIFGTRLLFSTKTLVRNIQILTKTNRSLPSRLTHLLRLRAIWKVRENTNYVNERNKYLQASIIDGKVLKNILKIGWQKMFLPVKIRNCWILVLGSFYPALSNASRSLSAITNHSATKLKKFLFYPSQLWQEQRCSVWVKA